MRTAAWISSAIAAAALLLASQLPQASARGVSANLTASWPSSPFFPLLETSEFLAEENPAFFWQFVEILKPQTAAIAEKSANVDALAEFAVQEALQVAPASKNILELMLATRTYSVKVEMYRQLGLDSGVRPCGADADTWAVFYSQKQCVEAVACSASELDAVLAGEKTSGETCIAAGVNDVELDVDHKYPQSSPTPVEKTAILYGVIGTDKFYGFHNKLKALAESNQLQYIARHFVKNSTLDTLLQGYGVALDIKNMEYKTIDDSKKNAEDDDAADLADEEENDQEGEEEDVEGFLFNVLLQRHGELSGEIKQFRDSLVKQDSQDQEVKAWHLKDLGLAAARDIIDAKHPLKRLQVLSQDFPKHAKKLAFSRKPLSDEFREEIELRHGEAVQSGLMNKFLLNGIAVDPTQRSFNIFDFMNTLKEEWSVAKKLAALPLNQSELSTMLTHVRESNQAQQAVRVHIRSPSDGFAPFYLNDIEKDPKTAQWPDDVDQLRRPAWNIIFVRKNMYEYVLVFDPMTSNGRTALNQIAFMRMRGAPLQWGLLISSKELLAAKTSEERELLIQDWKLFKMEDRANAWHFAKLLFLARAKDEEVGAKEEGASQRGVGRIVSSFIEGVVDEGTTDITVKHLVTCYADSTFGLMARAKLEQEAISVLRGDAHDDLVLSMTDYIQKKHLPLESSLFNGVLRKDIDVQSEIMGHLGRDQALYQEMARNDLLQNDADLVEELLATQETVPAYFTIFDSKSDEGSASSQNLLSHDSDAKIENLLESHVDYFHAAKSLLTPKKQTLLFLADLGNPAHAGHVYQGVKAALEDSEKALRVGVVPRFGSSEDAESQKKGQLVTSIISAVGTSDEEVHLRFVMDALNCVVRGKTLESMKSKLDGILSKIADEEVAKDDGVMAELKKLVGSDTIPTESASSQAKNAGLQQLSNILHGASSPDLARLYINGYPIDLPTNSISDEDMTALTGFDSRYRSQAVGKAFVKKSAKLTVEEANKVSLDIVKVCDLVDKYKKTDRAARLELEGSQLVIRLPGDPALKVSAYLDPLSEATQMISSLLLMLHNQLNATVEVVLLPATDYAEFPLQRFYRYLFDKTPSLATPSVEFRKLPIKPILTMKIETPEAWNVQVHQTQEDLDNLRVDPDSPVDVKATKSAVFRLESLLVYGQCRDKTFDMYTPPNGLQLVLERDVGATRMHRDTLVMKNLGYFQLQATPGVWSLHLARGRATELFEIVDAASDQALETTPVEVYDFGSRLAQLLVRKRKGREHDVLLDPKELMKSTGEGDVEPIAEDAGLLGSYWGSMMSLLGKKDKQDKGGNASAVVAAPESAVNRGRTGETIHVFSLASGHLYERFLKIMMSSVLKRTKNPVTFWLLENFLSPDFKQSIPALREKFGMDIRLVTYKWPNWLRQQTQKQRIIWGYKILFLDVLFPLGVQKIIYVDADQVVRADLKELWEMDLQGAPYGYTPFCDSRNVGFQFWRQGYWKDHLRGRPYHISALYVVDLALFRQMAAGDMLRATYDQLSADPNSLSNLDQDLPNYTQHQIKIFSLPQEWLWCDSWCSDETKGQAKTIDLCNNPKHKEPKLEMAKRVISGELFPESWVELDQEIKDAEATYFQRASAPASTQ